MTCDLNRSEDQRQILDAAGTMLAEAYPLDRLRDGAAEDLAALAEFGAFALALPDDEGGAGFSIADEALLHVLLGRHLLAPGAIAAPLAVRALRHAGDGATAEAVATGAVPVLAALASGEELLLFGPPGEGLAMILGADAPCLLPLGGVEARVEPGLGHTIPLARVAAGWRDHAQTVDLPGLPDLAALLLSAQLLGIAEATLDLAVAYAQDRRQFGRPIGAFQAVKHHAADMALRSEMVSAQLDLAALALAGGAEDAGFQVAALARLAPRAALENARACVQIHGGIGFSAEADAHHFVKQAHLLARLMPATDPMAGDAPLRPLKQGDTP
ncbi:hypothetical protein HKCCE2091_04765 [Rhodobacterales bacterium HKCCE2091]|nr:hypothetical protein [Rhodobacterales bacterium HKCCE2091]